MSFLLRALAGSALAVTMTVLPGAALRAAPLAEEAGREGEPLLELVESEPIETTLENPDIPDAYQVWLDMIAGASTRIDLAHFYASNEPDSRLEAVIAGLEAAADRGVTVRFLAEEKFYATYPQTLDRLAAHAGIEVRRYDVGKLMGGVLHEKMMLVDGREAFVGSQNFDWRSLTHIQELGMRIRVPAVVRFLDDLYETDWRLAGGADPSFRASPPPGGYSFPVAAGGDITAVTPVASPKGWLCDESLWDLPHIVESIDGAESTVRVQLLTYGTVGREGTYFDTLDAALRRAAARGVDVRLLVADWSQRPGTIEGLKSLEVLPHVRVRLVTIPPWSGGFVPYARVIHAKYLAVDGRRLWLGTSNWERDYFYASRNVGLIVESASMAARLDGFFEKTWSSPYAAEVDPCAEYEPPRRSR